MVMTVQVADRTRGAIESVGLGDARRWDYCQRLDAAEVPPS